MSNYNYLFRILIVGDTTVGKTSICNRISNNEFTPYSPATIGIDFNVFSLKLLDDSIIKCQLWDTAGCERFRSITRNYYNNTAVIILVFDLSDAASFRRLPTWLQEIKDNVKNEKYSILLLGNKSDLPPSYISRTEIMDFVEDNKLTYLETSAKNDTEARLKFSDYISELMTTTDFAVQSTGVTIVPLDITTKHRRGEDLCCCRFQ